MNELPKFLYGTAWKEERTETLTAQALRVGFNGIDTANQRKHYFEEGVGSAVQAAIAAGPVTRAQLFLQTKFTFQSGQDERLPYDPRTPIATQVQQSFQSSLEHFGTDYLDSFLLHGPSSRGKLTREDLDAWQAIEALSEAGRARFVGVSNFSLAQLQELVGVARVKPRFLQNRCHAKSGWDREVRALCREHGITYQGFSLLTGNRKELEGETMQALSKRLKRSPEQLIFRFALEVGMLPLTGSSSESHLRLDLGALDFSLEPADVELIERVGG